MEYTLIPELSQLLILSILCLLTYFLYDYCNNLKKNTLVKKVILLLAIVVFIITIGYGFCIYK